MAKSDSQQHKYREISVEPIIVNNFANEDKLNYNQLKQSDELVDLVQELYNKIKDLVNNRLTMRQKQIVNMAYFENMTQTAIARELGLCQPTVHKVIHGNLDYFNQGKRYGGAIKKLKKLCSNDADIVSLIGKIEKLREELIQDQT